MEDVESGCGVVELSGSQQGGHAASEGGVYVTGAGGRGVYS